MVTAPVAPLRLGRPSISSAAIRLAGLGLAVIVVSDGQPLWRLARVGVVAVIGVLLHRVSRLGSLGGGAVLFALGTTGFCVGVGVAVPHLTKTGVGVMGIAGLLALVSGLILMLRGAAAVVRGTAVPWRLLSIPTLLVFALVGLSAIGQAVAATNAPRTAVGGSTPADVGFDYEDVEFPASDGVALSGWFVPSENGAAVVLLHGAGSTRSSVLDHAVVLARNGYGVLLYDARGHGRSAGRAMDFGWYGDADIAGAVSFLQTRRGVDPERIAAVGMSMGAEQALGAAGTNADIRAVVAEGATNRIAADKEWQSEHFGLRGELQERIDQITYGLVDLLTSASPPTPLRDAVRAAAPRPVLLIAGSSVPDEPRAARYFRSASPDTVELWVAPDTGHTAGLRTHPAEWERRVVAFLGDALGSKVAPSMSDR